MADVRRIKINNTTYNIKDATARTNITNLQKAIFYATPEKYGAVGDGVTDDTTAIQTAVNNSKYVYFSKRYKITSGITVPAGVELFGSGTIIPNDYMNVFTVSGDNVIDGLNFTDGLSYENEWAHIYGFEVDNVVVKNCKFENIGIGYAILFDHSTHLKVEHNTIKNYAFSGIMFVHTCSYFDVLYNYIYNSSGRRIADHNYPICISAYQDHQYGAAHHVRCNYNYIEELSPFWEGIDSHGCNDYEIIGNTIKNVYVGIAMGYKRTGDTGFITSNCNGIIRNNIISVGVPVNEPSLEYSKGIYIASGDTTYTYNLDISNNMISGTQSSTEVEEGTAAISVSLGDGSADDINIEKNYINCTNMTCIGFGARGAANNIRIIGNFFHNIVGNSGPKYGIYLAQTRLYTNIIVADNACSPGLANDNTKRRFIRGVASNYVPRNHRLCTYINNSDCGLDKDSMDWFTSERSALSAATKAEGVAGQFIPSTGSGIAGWVCQSRGHWVAVAGTSV